MLEVARGAAYPATESQTKYIGAEIERRSDPVGPVGLSFAFFVAAIVAVIGQVLLTRTVAGRYMVAIGTNEEAVRLSGINPRPTKIVVFAISGMLAALAGIFNTSRLSSADPERGIGWELLRDCGGGHRRNEPHGWARFGGEDDLRRPDYLGAGSGAVADRCHGARKTRGHRCRDRWRRDSRCPENPGEVVPELRERNPDAGVPCRKGLCRADSFTVGSPR